MSFRGFKDSINKFHRRRRPVESYAWWQQLNYAQKFSVSSLFQFGYDIDFVRTANGLSLVVMSLDGISVTVNQDGVIDTHPNIKIRRNKT